MPSASPFNSELSLPPFMSCSTHKRQCTPQAHSASARLPPCRHPAVIRLAEVTTSFTGYFGLQTSCGSKKYSCRTEGYPGDKPQYGWRTW